MSLAFHDADCKLYSDNINNYSDITGMESLIIFLQSLKYKNRTQTQKVKSGWGERV